MTSMEEGILSRFELHRTAPTTQPRQNIADLIEPLPRLQVLPLPDDGGFALVLSGYRHATDLDPEVMAKLKQDCGAKAIVVFEQHIDVG